MDNPTQKKTLKLKNSKIRLLAQCMVDLMAYEQAKQVNNDVVVKNAWKYKNPGMVRLNIARTFNSLSTATDLVKKAEDSLKLQLFAEQTATNQGRSGNMLQGEFMTKFTTEVVKMLDNETDVEIWPVDVKDLDLDNNDIPCILLGALLGTVFVE